MLAQKGLKRRSDKLPLIAHGDDDGDEGGIHGGAVVTPRAELSEGRSNAALTSLGPRRSKLTRP
jgi:hypothetical protein